MRPAKAEVPPTLRMYLSSHNELHPAMPTGDFGIWINLLT
jgi:hypothetical protein